MREILKEWLKKLEFMTGLKQFREMSIEDMKSLLDCLEEKVKEYHWMTESRLNEIMKKGMEGNYGDFYSINVRTVSQWCSLYYEHHKQLIIVENFPRESDPEKSQDEIDYWLNKGKEMFADCWERAKEGEIRPLAEWIPTNYQKFVDLGILKEENYRFDENYESRMMRIEKGLAFSAQMLIPRKKEMVWRQFIKDMISKGVDLTQYL